VVLVELVQLLQFWNTNSKSWWWRWFKLWWNPWIWWNRRWWKGTIGGPAPNAANAGTAGTANTGGGGGGGEVVYLILVVVGGSGIVIIRYKFQ
jgi:hypothetical protein